MTATYRFKFGLVAALAAIALTALLVVLSVGVDPSQAQGIQHQPGSASIIVGFSDGSNQVQVITWTTPISRVAGLRQAGFEVEHDGAIICSIDGDGCPVSDCWCADNNWWQGGWVGGAWDSFYGGWPPADLVNGDAIAFHNGLAWAPPQHPAPIYLAIADGLAWLAPLQSAEDGSYESPFGAMGPSTDMGLALLANNDDPAEWRREPTSPSLLDFLLGALSTGYANTDAATAGKLGVTLAAMDGMASGESSVCWPPVGKKPMAYYNPSTGTFYESEYVLAGIQSWAIMGTVALSETVPITAVNALQDMANQDGGWPYSSQWGGSDTMASAQAIQALLATGVPTTSAFISDGLAFLKTHQNDDGGFFYESPGDSDLSSTAYAVQAIAAAGENPITGTWRTMSGTMYTNPISYLLSVQLPDGSFPSFSPMLATQQAIPALLQASYPLAVSQIPDCRSWSIDLPLVTRNR